MFNIYNYSDPEIVFENAKQYLGEIVIIRFSDKPPKKFMVLNPETNKWVHFGQMPYQDFTFSRNHNKRLQYLRRSGNIKGNWKNNKYSANNLSRNILW